MDSITQVPTTVVYHPGGANAETVESMRAAQTDRKLVENNSLPQGSHFT